jgi:hypothetical protein
MLADETRFKDSIAYKMLGWRHRHRRIGVFAIVAEIDDEPARAWVECRQCAAMFEFVGYEEWQLAEAAERMDADGSGAAAVSEVAN